MSRTAGRWLALLVTIGALGSPALAQVAPLPVPKITWRVENSFRFFSDAADTEVHRATFLALPPEDQLQHPILTAEQALSARHEDGWAETMFRDTCWDARNNRFACKDGGSYINPKSHRVILKINGVDEAAGLSCTWLTAPLGGALRGDVVTQPCSEDAHFEVPYPAGSAVSVEIGGREVATEKVVVKDLLVVGMGDSFASGEGNPDVPVRFSRDRSADYGTRSADSDLTGYPARIGAVETDRRQGVHSGERALVRPGLPSFALFAPATRSACSSPSKTIIARHLRRRRLFGLGGDVRPVPAVRRQRVGAQSDATCRKSRPSLRRSATSTKRRMQDLPEAYHMDGTIPELKGGLVLRKCDPINARKIDLMFVSVGGNDVGFSRLLANSVLSDESTLRKLGGWFGQVHSLDDASLGLEALILRYKSLNRAIHYLLHIPWEQSDRVLLTAYPGLALQGDGTSICPDGVAGMDVLPDFALSEQKARIGTWIADKLNTSMSEAAAHYQWTFVDSQRRDFAGRGLCAGHDVRRRRHRRRSASAAQNGGRLAALQPGGLQGVCLTSTLVPHAQRRVHDRQLPRRDVAAAEGAEARHLRLVPARARRHVFGRLPSDRRRARRPSPMPSCTRRAACWRSTGRDRSSRCRQRASRRRPAPSGCSRPGARGLRDYVAAGPRLMATASSMLEA